MIPSGSYFISPDPFISDPTDTRSYNRYAYVRYNPLTLTDPSGYCDTGSAEAPRGGDTIIVCASRDYGPDNQYNPGHDGWNVGATPTSSVAGGGGGPQGNLPEVTVTGTQQTQWQSPLPVIVVTGTQNQQMAANPWKRSPRFPCTWCGAPHGGTYGPYCPDCNKKSQDPNGGVPPNPSLPDFEDTPLPNLDDPAPMQVPQAPQLPWWLIFLEGILASA